MAVEDTKNKKRKGAVDAAPKAKKQKKSDETAPAPKSAKGKKFVEPAETTEMSAKPSRKHAVDYFSSDEPPVQKPEEKKTKKSKSAKAEVNERVTAAEEKIPEGKGKSSKGKKKNTLEEFAPEPEIESAVEAPVAKPKKSKKSVSKNAPVQKQKELMDNAEETALPTKSKKPQKASKKEQSEPKEHLTEPDGASDAGEEDGEDHAAALLAGFESDNDEADPETDQDLDTSADAPIDSSLSKRLKQASKNVENPGVVYVGRIPHGFFEPQMKAYFRQFGKVNRLRLSRNKKTGASKHYAFVEFASEEVAEIVAKTMDKYLMFGHILQCRVIPDEQVHEKLFVGANERFKVMPRNRMAGSAMARGADRQQWDKRVEKEKKRRSAKNKKLKEDFGYEYTASSLKSVDDVPKQAPALENGDVEQLLIEAAAHDDKPALEIPQIADADGAPVKKSKKGRKTKDDTAAEEQLAIETSVATEKKVKKEKKAKADAAAAAAPELATKEKKRKAKPADGEGVKSKKTKKSKV